MSGPRELSYWTRHSDQFELSISINKARSQLEWHVSARSREIINLFCNHTSVKVSDEEGKEMLD